MKRIIRLFGIAVIAAFTFTAITAAIASAETTKILPEPTAAAPLTNTIAQIGEAHLVAVGGLEVKCKKGFGAEKWTSANNGSFEVIFKECIWLLLNKCTGTGLGEGEIFAKGEVHFWLALQMETGGSKLIGALVFLIKPAVEFTCWNKPKTIKYEVVLQENSCVAAKDLNLNSLIVTDHEEFAEWSSGETLILSVLPAGGTSEVACLPTDTFMGGTSELFAMTANFEVSDYKKNQEAITIELMNPEG